MSKSDFEVPAVARGALEDVLTRALLSYFSEVPARPGASAPMEVVPAPGRRLLLIAHLGLASDCLCSTLVENGYSVVMSPLDAPITADNLDADLVILSVSQCRPDTLAAIRERIVEIRAAAIPIPAMAMLENAQREETRGLADTGLAAIVVGPLSAKIVLATIHLVLLGGAQVSAEICLRSMETNGRAAIVAPKVAETIGPSVDEQALQALGNFTGREVALLSRLRKGMQNKVIAHELGIAESTVKVHLRNIMAKLHASNRTQVASILAGNELLLARSAGDLDIVPVGNGQASS
jgi:DNA-binding NarL/FixJ family response regulator